MIDLMMDANYVCPLLYSLLRLSFVSVVFDFNNSLIDVAPVSPILFTVYVLRKKGKELFIDGCCLCDVFCFHYSDRVQ